MCPVQSKEKSSNEEKRQDCYIRMQGTRPLIEKSLISSANQYAPFPLDSARWSNLKAA
ncbi:hypothetical protein ACP4OV_010695 [Aristida adscensionis]